MVSPGVSIRLQSKVLARPAVIYHLYAQPGEGSTLDPHWLLAHNTTSSQGPPHSMTVSHSKGSERMRVYSPNGSHCISTASLLLVFKEGNYTWA